MIKPAICFEMLYGNDTPSQKIKKIADAGFEYVEFWSWRDKDIDAIKTACNENGVQVANFSGQRSGDLVSVSTHEVLLADYKDALKSAAILGNTTLMVLTNELGDGGVVVNSYPEMSLQNKDKAVVDGLKKLSPLIPPGGSLLLEPLNTVKDHVGYHLYDLDEAVKLLVKTGDSRIKILCDLYHQGMMGDDLISLIQKHVQHIGYFHIADIPGRGEPNSGSINWKAVLTEIKNSSYEGVVGFEYAPSGDSDKSLAVIQSLWNSVF